MDAILYTDPACPWAYSGLPALATLRWRYGDQLDWRIVMIGLTENPDRYIAMGMTPGRRAKGLLSFRRFGMPFGAGVKDRMTSSGLACRTVVATRLAHPEREPAALRALQIANFTTPLLLDDPEQLADVLSGVDGLDGAALVAATGTEEVEAAYQADRAEARTAAGSPTEFQGKAANTDGAVRYTAPSIVFATGERSLEAGGFQPIEAYDVVIANLDPTLDRRPPPADPLPVLTAFPDGLVTAEIAAVMAPHLAAPDPVAAEAALFELIGEGQVVRVPAGDDALWRSTAPVAVGAAA